MGCPEEGGMLQASWILQGGCGCDAPKQMEYSRLAGCSEEDVDGMLKASRMLQCECGWDALRWMGCPRPVGCSEEDTDGMPQGMGCSRPVGCSKENADGMLQAGGLLRGGVITLRSRADLLPSPPCTSSRSLCPRPPAAGQDPAYPRCAHPPKCPPQ